MSYTLRRRTLPQGRAKVPLFEPFRFASFTVLARIKEGGGTLHHLHDHIRVSWPRWCNAISVDATLSKTTKQL